MLIEWIQTDQRTQTDPQSPSYLFWCDHTLTKAPWTCVWFFSKQYASVRNGIRFALDCRPHRSFWLVLVPYNELQLDYYVVLVIVAPPFFQFHTHRMSRDCRPPPAQIPSINNPPRWILNSFYADGSPLDEDTLFPLTAQINSIDKV